MIIQADIKDKVLEGCRLAIERLLEQKRKANSFAVVSDNGKVIKIKASDLIQSTSATRVLLQPRLTQRTPTAAILFSFSSSRHSAVEHYQLSSAKQKISSSTGRCSAIACLQQIDRALVKTLLNQRF